MLCPPIPPVESRRTIALVRLAWDRIVEHLSIEAKGRSAREVDVIDRYELLEPFGSSHSGIQGDLSVVLVSRVLGGDVFEQVEHLVGLGQQTLDSLVSRIRRGEQYSYSEPLRDAFDDGRCLATIELNVYPEELLQHWDELCQDLTDREIPPPSPRERPYSEQVGERALARVMADHEIKWTIGPQASQQKEGIHDLDLLCPATNAVIAAVEITELTSETGRHWSSRDKSGEPKMVKGSDKRLRYQWHARLSMSNLANPSMRRLDKDTTERSKARKAIDDDLVALLKWAESQMSTVQGMENLANLRIQDPYRGLPKVATARFTVQASEPGGCLKVSYDSVGSSYNSRGPSRAAELINERIKDKAKRNQAHHKTWPARLATLTFQQTPKWLVIYLDSFLTGEVPGEIEMRHRDRTGWSDFAAKINLRHFEEVWLVWDARDWPDRSPNSQRPINTLILTPKGSRYFSAV